MRINPELKPVDPNGDTPPARLGSSDADEWVRSIHPRQGDFEDGDLIDRIYDHAPYKLKQVDLSDIEIDEFDVDDEFVENVAKGIAKSGQYVVPIIAGSKGSYETVDGLHRLNALVLLGVKKAQLYVGR